MLSSLKYANQWFNDKLPGNSANLIFFVLGVAISILITWLARDYREISIDIQASPVTVFDSTRSSPKLTLLDDTGQPITGTVYIQTIHIENSGSQAIERDEVRNDIRISFNPIVRIIDPVVVRESHDEANFRLLEDPSSINSVKLEWDYFDPDFNTTVQIMYEGTEPADVTFSGYVEGLAPNQFRILSNAISPFIFILIAVLVFIAALLLTSLVYVTLDRWQKGKVLQSYLFNLLDSDKAISRDIAVKLREEIRRAINKNSSLTSSELDFLRTHLAPEQYQEVMKMQHETEVVIGRIAGGWVILFVTLGILAYLFGQVLEIW